MKIRLVSHASVVIDCKGTKIWTDPWLFSKAFNESWALWPPASFADWLLDGIDYIWVSHEHPDHLNFPTLRSLNPNFKHRVTFLYQNNNPERIFSTLRDLGYRKFQVLAHRQITKLAPLTSVYCYRVGTLDSCLGVTSGDKTVLNINDARLNATDYARILRDLGHVDALLNQFSIAVKDSVVEYEKHAAVAATNVLESLSADHRGLGANVTIPFASLMYFSSIDNQHMNTFANTLTDVVEFCQSRGQRVAILYPGDEYEVNGSHDSAHALARYKEAYSRLPLIDYDVPPVVPLTQLAASLHTLVRALRQRFPRFLFRRFKPLRVRVPDLNTTLDISIASDSITEIPGDPEPDVIIYSQPLDYCLAQTWGMGTLSISGRFILLRNERNWRMHKALLALNNAEVDFKPRHLLRRRNWIYLKDRLKTARRYTDRARLGIKADSALLSRLESRSRQRS